MRSKSTNGDPEILSGARSALPAHRRWRELLSVPAMRAGNLTDPSEHEQVLGQMPADSRRDVE